MTRKELAARAALALLALVFLAAAVGFGVLAVDIARWRSALPAGDVRSRVSEEAGSWEPSTLLPVRTSRGLLGVEDDIDFRRAVRAIRLARLDDVTVSDPVVALLRNEAQARLEAIAGDTGYDDRRRSRAAGLLGVLGLARLVTETQEREALLGYAVSNFVRAIELDPANGEAKLNLEIALQRGRSTELQESAGGANPSPGGGGASGAGAGEPGSGY